MPWSGNLRLADHLLPSCWCSVVSPAVAGSTPFHRQGVHCRPALPLLGSAIALDFRQLCSPDSCLLAAGSAVSGAASHTLGAAAEEWQPLVPVADDHLGDFL